MTAPTTVVRTLLFGGALTMAVLLVVVPARGSTRHRPVPPGQPHPARLLPGGLTIGPLSSVRSRNWAGYVDTGRTFSLIRSTWKQPKVSCTAMAAIAAFWVGLDGYRTGTVEQGGTLAYCHQGHPTYYTWWEMYPRTQVQFVHASVKPGDKVTSSVVRKGTSYVLKVVDHTHPGNSFKRTTTCGGCRDASAEWIAERPTGSRGLFPLARFDRVVFAGDKVGVGSARGHIDKYHHDRITMVNGGGSVLADASPLKRGGKKFVATWHRML